MTVVITPGRRVATIECGDYWRVASDRANTYGTSIAVATLGNINKHEFCTWIGSMHHA